MSLTIREAVEQQRKFQQEVGEYMVFDEGSGPWVWCHPNDRQSFIDAGWPAESIVHGWVEEDEE